jgi:predicted ATPase
MGRSPLMRQPRNIQPRRLLTHKGVDMHAMLNELDHEAKELSQADKAALEAVNDYLEGLATHILGSH